MPLRRVFVIELFKLQLRLEKQFTYDSYPLLSSRQRLGLFLPGQLYYITRILHTHTNSFSHTHTHPQGHRDSRECVSIAGKFA